MFFSLLFFAFLLIPTLMVALLPSPFLATGCRVD
jgi:hypothetical protein